MNNGVLYALRFFGLILSAITTVFTVILWSELPSETWTQMLMGLAGFALEGCKFLLLILAVLFYRRGQRIAAVVSGLLAALLFVVSIAASVGFLEKSEQQQREQSWQGQQIRQQLGQIDSEISLLTDAARRDIQNGYRERGLQTRTDIETLRQQRQALTRTPVSGVADSSFSGVSGLLGLDDDRVRLGAWLLLSVLIDGVAGACWVFLAMLQRAETVSETRSETVPDTRAEPCGVGGVTGTPEAMAEPAAETVSGVAYGCFLNDDVMLDDDHHDLFLSVADKIASNEPGYDDGMSLNRLMRLESIGYTKARKVMDKIEAQKKQA